jgi:peptidyl-prolyl cis-trans isomerase B (cyclophilin B)
VPTNEQRRATAKRKLERQLERRVEQQRKRRIYTIIGAVVAVIAVAGGVAAAIVLTKKDSDTTAADGTSASPTSAAPTGSGRLPAFAAPAGLGENCQYPDDNQEASKPNKPPRTGKVPTDPAEVSASMVTNQGNIGLQLDNGKAPCTVNSFASLANQGYFNDTPCHRISTDGLFMLQCGDPTGKGTGGPGYGFANEYPTNQYRPDDPALKSPVTYPKGTLAMANTGAPGSNGSQFFLVYRDSQLPPGYTAFGTIDQTGLDTLEKIAEAGVQGKDQFGQPLTDGKPVTDVQIKSVQLD